MLEKAINTFSQFSSVNSERECIKNVLFYIYVDAN